MIQVLWLPGWLPARTNDLLSHRMKAHRLKGRDKDAVARAALAHGARRATTCRRVDWHLVVPAGRRRFDADGIKESGLDALVAAGLLVGDSPRWVREGPVTWSRALDGGPWGTFVILEDT